MKFTNIPDHNFPEAGQAFQRLLQIMDTLRGQCPWDREQTFQSLRHLTIEEVYELGDAILQESFNQIKNELGDLLLHVVFYARLGQENGAFSIVKVIDDLCQKLIDRHPHIYGQVKAEDSATVKQNWEKIKLSKKNGSGVLSGVPVSLPSLVKAQRIQDKAAGIGFEWENKSDVWEKVEEEILELKNAETMQQDKIEEEFGDVLFSLVNYARFLKINAEDALEKANRKFIKRFELMEQLAQSRQLNIYEMDLKSLDALWNEAKIKKKVRKSS